MTTLFDQLRDLEQRCEQRRKTLSTRGSETSQAQGVMFRSGNLRMLVTIKGVSAVMDVPKGVVRVPGTARWVVGIASHRGDLLPLYDLGGMLLGAYIDHLRRGRVLVMQDQLNPMGILVDEVLGLRRFRLHPGESIAEQPESIGNILLGTMTEGGDRIPVVDLQRIRHLPLFERDSLVGG